jgi:serine/threonine-protein kinase
MGQFDISQTGQSDPLIGKTLSGRYVVRERIGKGASGAVYKAARLQDQADVAIKVLHADLVSNMESVRQFQQEAKAVAGLTHPHIVRLLDVGLAPGGQPYLVMDYVHGETLADRLTSGRPMTMRQALTIMRQTCEALTEAHNRGVLHRDVKPANIMLTRRFEQTDFVVVLDFSVAQVISTASDISLERKVLGTPTYMSPERFKGESGDFRSDIYSMGIIMFQILAGKPPFIGADRRELMNAHMYFPPPRLADLRPANELLDRLEESIYRALAKDKYDRQENMRQLLSEVEEVEKEWYQKF